MRIDSHTFDIVKRRLWIWLLCGFGLSASGQDIHFSQFEFAPFALNPSLAGQFNGDYRFILNQRAQWRSVTVPYNTVGFSADARNPKEIPGLGAGLGVYHDRAGDSRFSHFQINAAGSLLIPITKDSLHSFSSGLQLGMTNQRIDYSALTYDNQWNGIGFDPGVDPGENFLRDSRTYLNFHAGLSYFYQPERRKRLLVGISGYNITRPAQSFFDQPTVDLALRINAHLSVDYPINEDWDVMISAFRGSQMTYRETIIGAAGRYILEKRAGLYRTVFGGFYYRTRDAGYLLAGMDYDQWRGGISYDFNLSGLQPASRGRGGLEFSLQYIIAKPKIQKMYKRICPEFI
jgi:type IX secretion system PorP/SprF family membrane protein